jgi:hypothetical protein
MTRTTSAVAGLFAAPFVPIVIAVALSLPADSHHPPPRELIEAVLMLYFLNALRTLILGVPAFLLLKRFGVSGWGSAMGAGAAVGVLDSALIVGPHGHRTDSLLVSVPTGTLKALTFWLIWRRGIDPATPSIPGNG